MISATMGVKKLTFVVFSAAAFAMASVATQAAETPASLAGATVVTAEKVKDLQGKGAVVVDTRVANEYAEAHIKGAISVPYKEKSAKAPNFDPSQDSFDLSKLPSDRNAVIVMYCNGGECWKSYKASKVAVDAGYKKIHWFRGGFPEWKSKGFPIE